MNPDYEGGLKEVYPTGTVELDGVTATHSMKS